MKPRTRAAVAVIALLSLAGCGSGSSGGTQAGGGAASSSGSPSAAADPTIAKGRICTRLDANAVATLIGADASKFHQFQDLAAGQQYKIFPTDTTKTTSASWSCSFTTYPPGKFDFSKRPDAFYDFHVSIARAPSSSALLADQIQRIEAGLKSSYEKATCTEGSAAYLGSAGKELTCSVPGNTKKFVDDRTSISAFGLFGTTSVSCGSAYSAHGPAAAGYDAKVATLKTGTAKACADALKAISK